MCVRAEEVPGTESVTISRSLKAAAPTHTKKTTFIYYPYLLKHVHSGHMTFINVVLTSMQRHIIDSATLYTRRVPAAHDLPLYPKSQKGGVCQDYLNMPLKV